MGQLLPFCVSLLPLYQPGTASRSMQQAPGTNPLRQQQVGTDSAAQFYSQLVQLHSAAQLAQDLPQHDLAQQQQQQQDELCQQQLSPPPPPQQQQLATHHPGRRMTSSQLPAAAGQAQMPFAPVRFSSRTHLLDPNTGTLTLPPKAAPAGTEAPSAGSSSLPQQQQRRQRQPEAQQPMHPVAPAHIASTKRPIDRSNLGYKLLSKAGWQEGQGLGASEQGIGAPLAVTHHKGNTGLGFSKQQQPLQQQQSSAPAAGASSTAQAAAASGAAAAAGPVLGGKRVAALVAAELAAEDLDTKVKRHRQLQEQKVKEQRDKAIQSYMYRAFNDVEAPDSNPLLAKSHRLTATNPLLD